MEVSAGGKKTAESTLNQACAELSAVACGQRNLQSNDQKWLNELGKTLGTNSLPVVIESCEIDLLSAESMREHPHGAQINVMLAKLVASVRAMAEAEQIQYSNFDNDGTVIPVHNQAVAELMRAQYSSQSFAALFDFCQAKNVFALKINQENGLVKTAEVEENWEMSGRQWVTDTVRCGDIERRLDGRSWRKAMLTLCRFYNQPDELLAIENSMADPEFYRSGGLLDGVAHIFIPQSLERDRSWFNNKRLESHGLALKAICDTIYAQEESFGFSADQLQNNLPLIGTTIANLASYLKAINTDKSGNFDFCAPSAGPWEEIPFVEGLTWDTEAMRSGFASLRTLLSDERNQALNNFIVAAGKPQWQWIHDQKTLTNLIDAAHTKIMQRLFSGALPVENPQRPIDCSLAFIATSTIEFDDDALTNCRLHFRLLAAVEENLVRDHGIIRYAPFDLAIPDGRLEKVFDSYLADNYWLLPEIRAMLAGNGTEAPTFKDYGSSDCSTSEEYLARVRQARPDLEAQWCFVSVIAEGYARQVNRLLKLKARGEVSGDGQNQDEMDELISHGLAKATLFINRSFARITTAGYKANGMPCPDFAIPEAYEMVQPGRLKSPGALAGVNTPLAWGQASLASAAQHFKETLDLVT